MGMKEIMEARRLREAGIAPVVKSDHGLTIDAESKVVPDVPAVAETPKVAEVKEVAAAPVGKIMTFAEKIAEKKRLAEQAKDTGQLTSATVVGVTSANALPATTAKVSPIDLGEEPAPSTGLNLPAIASAALRLSREERMKEILKGLPDDAKPEDAQAYADIKARIDELVDLSGEPLVGAMSDLKKALNKNPNAVLLMLDSDIGQMVIALRAMTGVALEEAAKPKAKGGAKAKNVALTAAQLEAAFEEM